MTALYKRNMQPKKKKEKPMSSRVLEDAEIEEDSNFDRNLDLITDGAQPFVKKHLLTKIRRVNANVIVAYILAMQVETNPALRYRLEIILKLKQLSEFHNNKPFIEMTRDDIIAFLDRLRKPDALDPLHKWKGTYENNRITLLRFFKWLYAQDVEQKKRPIPVVMQNIPRIRRLEQDTHKESDIWTEQDELLFCKYCPSKREKALLLVARDTGFRASDLVKIKMKDLVEEQMEDGSYTSKITIINTKTGIKATGRIYRGYPYLKDWLSNGHPFPNVENAPIFCGTGKKNTGRKIQPHTVWKIFDFYKKVVFPKMLKDGAIESEDLTKVKELLQKPWNPHWKRHIATTEISKKVKDPGLVNKLMGWSPRSNTIKRYQHYADTDAIDALNAADGLVPKDSTNNNKNKKKDLLKPRICYNCQEPNKPDSKFCSKCRFTLDVFGSMKEAETRQQELEELKDRFRSLEINTRNLVNHALGARELTLEEKKEREEKIRLEQEEFLRKKGIKFEDILRKKEKEISECIICSPTYRCSWHGGPKNLNDSSKS